MRAHRSWLFVPAHDERRLEKAHLRGADVLILDLEDGVAPAAKADARAALSTAVDRLRRLGQLTAVRINGVAELWREDLAAAARAGATALMVPKAESQAQLAEHAAALEALGEPAASVALLPLIESPRALESLGEIADAPRVAGLALGAEDFALSLGVEPGPECLDMPCRMIALAAAARGLAALGAPISISAFDPPAPYAEAARRARAMGLTGTLCIHPAQVTAVSQAFAPTVDEVQDARAVLDAWRAAGGAGVARLGERMIDLPLVRRAERLLDRAGRSPDPQ